jgi:hypothetical protein
MPEPISQPRTVYTQGRPFPWFCGNCRRKEVRLATIPYECERYWDGKPITVIIPALHVPKCSHCGELDFTYDSEEQIKRAFREQIASQQNGQETGNGSSSLPAASNVESRTKVVMVEDPKQAPIRIGRLAHPEV